MGVPPQREQQLPERLIFDVFEMNINARELRKNGKKIKIQNQPFQVLTALASRSGEVVSRQDLYTLFSTHGTYDSKHALNNAIQKIRAALGDSRHTPRFVETIGGLGYRFLPPVEIRFTSNRAGTPPALTKRIFIAEGVNHIPDGFIAILIPNGRSKSSVDLRHPEFINLFLKNTEDASLLLKHFRIVAASPQAYCSFEEFLDDLYTRYLRDRYPIFTYGSSWVLCRPSPFLTWLALPWNWLLSKGRQLNESSIAAQARKSKPFEAYGISQAEPGVWVVLEHGFSNASAIFTSNDSVAEAVSRSHPKGVQLILMRCYLPSVLQSLTNSRRRLPNSMSPLGRRVRLNEIDPNAFNHTFLFAERPGGAILRRRAGYRSKDVFVVEDLPQDRPPSKRWERFLRDVQTGRIKGVTLTQEGGKITIERT